MATSRLRGGTSIHALAGNLAVVPELIVSSPAMDRSSVDLPQPDGPTSATKAPFGIVRLMPFRAWNDAVVLVDVRDLDLRRHFRAPEVRPATMRR